MEHNALDIIADKFGTDKKILCHGYTRAYDKFFSPIRNSVKNLIEIGIWEGASAKMWKEYFNNATIHCLDITKSSVDSIAGIERINGYHINACDKQFWTSLNFKAEIIIEDGSHIVEEQVKTLDLAWDSVLPGGYYVIEDTHSSFHDAYKQDTTNKIGFYSTVFNRILAQQSYEHLQGDWYEVRKKMGNRIDRISYDIFGIYSFSGLIVIEKTK